MGNRIANPSNQMVRENVSPERETLVPGQRPNRRKPRPRGGPQGLREAPPEMSTPIVSAPPELPPPPQMKYGPSGGVPTAMLGGGLESLGFTGAMNPGINPVNDMSPRRGFDSGGLFPRLRQRFLESTGLRY